MPNEKIAIYCCTTAQAGLKAESPLSDRIDLFFASGRHARCTFLKPVSFKYQARHHFNSALRTPGRSSHRADRHVQQRNDAQALCQRTGLCRREDVKPSDQRFRHWHIDLFEGVGCVLPALIVIKHVLNAEIDHQLMPCVCGTCDIQQLSIDGRQKNRPLSAGLFPESFGRSPRQPVCFCSQSPNRDCRSRRHTCTQPSDSKSEKCDACGNECSARRPSVPPHDAPSFSGRPTRAYSIPPTHFVIPLSTGRHSAMGRKPEVCSA